MENNGKILCWLRKTWLSLRILGLIVGLLVTVAYAYAKLDDQVSNNTLVAKKAAQKADANEKTIIRMQTNLEYIIGGIDDIKEDLKNARR